MTADREEIRKKVERKFERRRDDLAIAGFLRSLKANVLSGGFAIILGVTLLVGARASAAKLQFLMGGLFFVAIGWSHLMAFRQGKAIRACINRIEELSERVGETTEEE